MTTSFFQDDIVDVCWPNGRIDRGVVYKGTGVDGDLAVRFKTRRGVKSWDLYQIKRDAEAITVVERGGEFARQMRILRRRRRALAKAENAAYEYAWTVAP